MSFWDLHASLAELNGTTVDERVKEFVSNHPKLVRIVAIGGFPVVLDAQDKWQWCGSPLTIERLVGEMRQALGLSATLTYMNRKEHSLDALGDICVMRGHDWAYKWITFSVVFSGFAPRAELAFARDKRFWLSWPVGQSHYPLFVATGSIADWKKFTSHCADNDFDEDAREAMTDAGRLFVALEKLLETT